MRYTLFSVRTFSNAGKAKIAKGSVCATCGKAFEPKQSITCHTVQTAFMPAPAFYYYHTTIGSTKGCEPHHGSGWGKAMPGLPVIRPNQVEVGDVLLQYCRQFDAYNVVLVTKTEWQGEPENLRGKKFYCIFIDPATMRNKKPKVRQGGDDERCVWHHEIADAQQDIAQPAGNDVGRSMRREFYRPVMKLMAHNQGD
ncbi:MAG: hypothetical protein WCI73_11965 [Phycisphaerae bacterium]